jgi:hypothetical protein
MYVYAAAMIARRTTGPPVHCWAATLDAVSRPEAEGKALRLLRGMAPEDGGWFAHKVSIIGPVCLREHYLGPTANGGET